jgi:hypothetical protein
MADNGRKSKLVPIIAAVAVILVGAIGLVRGCGYATEPNPNERPEPVQPVREAPNV